MNIVKKIARSFASVIFRSELELFQARNRVLVSKIESNRKKISELYERNKSYAERINSAKSIKKTQEKIIMDQRDKIHALSDKATHYANRVLKLQKDKLELQERLNKLSQK